MPAFPVARKVWQNPIYRELLPQTTVSLQNQAAFVAMHGGLLAPPKNPWVLRGCSNGVAFNTAGTNLIAGTGDVVSSNSGARTWAWYQQASGLQLVVAFDQAAGPSQITFAASFGAGFTGGSLTARPTATDESPRSGVWFIGTAGTAHMHLHVIHSDDGTMTYGIITYLGFLVSAWVLGSAYSAHEAWTPLIADIEGSNALASSNLNIWNTFYTTSRIFSYASGSAMNLRQTHWGTANTLLINQQNQRAGADEEWQGWSVGLVCRDTPMVNYSGLMTDLYRSSLIVPPGYIFRNPNGGKDAYASVGAGYLFPWRSDFPARFV